MRYCGVVCRWLVQWWEKVVVLRRLHRPRLGRWIARQEAAGEFVSAFTYSPGRSCSRSYSLLILVLGVLVVPFSLRHRVEAVDFLGLLFAPGIFLLVLLLFRLGY
jgi:hypothetical protein